MTAPDPAFVRVSTVLTRAMPALPSQRADFDAGEQRPPDFQMSLRVYYEDTDAGGIVYYANWLRYFERARSDWLREMGAVHSRLAQDDDLAFVVREVAVDYRRPARLDDVLDIDVRLIEARRASWLLRQSARRGDERDPLVVAQVRIAAIRCSDGRPTGIPRWLHARRPVSVPFPAEDA